MPLPFLLSGTEPAVRLYELADGRFQLIQQGPVARVMTGYRYLLVETALAAFLQDLAIERVRYEPAILFNRGTGEEFDTHVRIQVGQIFDPTYRDAAFDGMRILTMHDEHFFVTAELKDALEASPFGRYLHFSEGLSSFASTAHDA